MDVKISAVLLNALVLEDDGITQELLGHLLRDMNFAEISFFGDGAPALDHLNEVGSGYYDLVVCDWHMRTMSGLEFLAVFRQLEPETPFLMLTGDATRENVVEAHKAGVTEFIAKPFSRKELQEKLARVLREKLQRDYRDPSNE
ncbi:response regulator [Bowmanella denitrificans]|uniref:response regulator n=1 Tax=Bowmanella denitrificans TaxID=366582 RepID=UPI000C9B3FD2|nr:response regulator [Bowmanella denitrificans]